MQSMPHLSRNSRNRLIVAALLLMVGFPVRAPLAQTVDNAEQSPVEANQPALLTEDQLEVFVARIALYPDDPVASASLFPVQIVDAQRYLERVKSDKSLKPKQTWNDSVISLLNYPEIVDMMGNDLDAGAVSVQIAILIPTRLRPRAVGKRRAECSALTFTFGQRRW